MHLQDCRFLRVKKKSSRFSVHYLDLLRCRPKSIGKMETEVKINYDNMSRQRDKCSEHHFMRGYFSGSVHVCCNCTTTSGPLFIVIVSISPSLLLCGSSAVLWSLTEQQHIEIAPCVAWPKVQRYAVFHYLARPNVPFIWWTHQWRNDWGFFLWDKCRVRKFNAISKSCSF